MPTYDYACRKCGKRFALVMTMSEHERKKARCPKCSSVQLDRRIGNTFANTSKKS